MEHVVPCPDAGHQGLPLEPGLGVGPGSERLVAGPILMGPGRVKPKETTWVHLSTGSPPVGGAKGVECSVSWAAAEGGDIGGLIPDY